ncbi:hypothetical protein [Streptomyces sp. NRRL S-1896]|uniref:hypothetical protein n=1 Tax=Streptomyces sp. NRRL S-1896 TaxID=1463893 RepID=UPI000AAAD131|nr:hypothetical protein [Streptomyces sp. NRRL S-1896]
MQERTHAQPQPPTPPLTPQPNRILAEPATIDACARDYAQAADVRQALAAQEARQR